MIQTNQVLAIARKEELKNIIASGLHSFDEYNKAVGEYKGYNIMDQEIKDLQKKDDDNTETYICFRRKRSFR